VRQYTDLDLAGRRLWVRLGKGQRDRPVYLSDTACQALFHYLAGYHRPADAPLWIWLDGKVVDSNWLKCRLPALGAQIGVTPLTAHRLRHTLATRPLNAGMDITCVLCDIHLVSPLRAYLTGTFWTNCDLTFQRQDDRLTYV
jgi:site-specific recombinase XerC